MREYDDPDSASNDGLGIKIPSFTFCLRAIFFASFVWALCASDAPFLSQMAANLPNAITLSLILTFC
jgi:hypothetical protein